MWIKNLRLQSYYSFKDSGWIDLSPTFNVFVGTNNSGKSALLRSLALTLQSCPHRNKDEFHPGSMVDSRIDLDIHLSISELLDRHSRSGSSPRFPGSSGHSSERTNELLTDVSMSITVEAFRTPGAPYQPRDLASISALRFPSEQTSYNMQRVGTSLTVASNAGGSDNLVDILNFSNIPAIFYFDPERLHVGRAPFADERSLSSDARNLPNVLAYLQGSRPDVFDRIILHVAEISQSMKSARVTPSGGNNEIILWPTEDRSRSEFSFTLSESGTGIGQLLAILTAAATNDQCTIVVDEINTFLHPSATKRLISILRTEYGQHQYIISTHSPDVISSLSGECINLIKKSEFESAVKRVDPGNLTQLRSVAAELGFSMMDVFGNDRLVWVEGETELLVFPYLMRSSGKIIPAGLGFSAVASASDFSPARRSVRSITEMYEHVAKRAAPLLKGLAFGLDREENSDEAVRSLETSKRKLRFLPVRSLENYALDCEAIAIALTKADGNQFSGEQVRSFLLEKGGDVKFRAKSVWKGELNGGVWWRKVDAAKLLHDCFLTLTEARTEYRKTRDTLEIIKAIQERQDQTLKELVEYLEKLIEIASRDTSP